MKFYSERGCLKPCLPGVQLADQQPLCHLGTCYRSSSVGSPQPPGPESAFEQDSRQLGLLRSTPISHRLLRSWLLLHEQYLTQKGWLRQDRGSALWNTSMMAFHIPSWWEGKKLRLYPLLLLLPRRHLMKSYSIFLLQSNSKESGKTILWKDLFLYNLHKHSLSVCCAPKSALQEEWWTSNQRREEQWEELRNSLEINSSEFRNW